MNERPAADRSDRPIQFRLRSLLVAVALVGVLFSLLTWLGVPPEGQLIVLAILGLGLAAAVALWVSIAGKPGDGRHDEDP